MTPPQKFRSSLRMAAAVLLLALGYTVYQFTRLLLPALPLSSYLWISLASTGLMAGGVALLRQRRAPRGPGAVPQDVERALEQWIWLLSLFGALMLSAAGEAAFTYPAAAHALVLGGLAWNTLAHVCFPALGSPVSRVHAHLLVLALLAGLLHVAGGPAGHGYLVILAVLPVLAAVVSGRKASNRLLAAGMAAVVLSEAGHSWLGSSAWLLSLSSAALQSLLLAGVSTAGIRAAEASRARQDRLQAALASMRETEAERARLAAIVEATPDFVSMADQNRNVFYVNPAGQRMFGLEEAAAGTYPGYVIGNNHPDWARDLIVNEGIPTAAREGAWQGETAFVGADGREIPLLQTIIAHPGLTRDGGAVFSTIARDISDRKELEDQLRHMALHDPLTGLANRRHFQETLERELAAAREAGTTGALLLADLNGFKYINDTFGHAAGDELLQAVAGLLRDQADDQAFIARLGGDEFGLILPRTRGAAAEDTAGRLLQALGRHPFLTGGQPVRLSASIGIALFPGHGLTGSELLVHADVALYEAKQTGRNTFAVYTTDAAWRATLDARFVWEQRIQDALRDDLFLLEAQPIWSLATGDVLKYELLLRMRDSDGSVYPPAAFLHVAEDLGLIHAIDRWVVRRAVSLLAACRQEGRSPTLAVNLSGKAFGDPELLPLLETELSRTGVDPGQLVLEITETAAVTDTSLARRFVRRLSALGCRFAIDDFGAGFTSYALLKQLPVHYLKLDGSFVQNLPGDGADLEFIRGMTRVAHGLGLEVVAEFVGSAETASLLKELGVDHAQGFYLGRPQPVSGPGSFIQESHGPAAHWR